MGFSADLIGIPGDLMGFLMKKWHQVAIYGEFKGL
jgi:hypothetical protein